MVNLRFSTLPLAALVLLALCSIALAANANATGQKPAEAEYPLIQWTDLMPEDDLKALLNPPEYLDDIVDGSPEDQLDNVTNNASEASKDDPYQQALVSKRVRPEFDKRKVKIPGFIVPLAFDDDMVIKEFFLVPFFGACIHVPPPPPNQMIHISYAVGLKLDSLYDPFFVEGTLLIKTHQTEEMGTSSYSLTVAKIYPYSE